MASLCQLSPSHLRLFGLRTLICHSVKVYLTLQLIVSCFPYLAKGAICKKTEGSDCKCESPGMKVDLTSLPGVPGGSYSAPGNTSEEVFFYNPCKPFSKSGACQEVLMCQRNKGSYYVLGRSGSVVFTGSPEDKNLALNYTVKTPSSTPVTRHTRVALICSHSTTPQLKYLQEKPTTYYMFEFHTNLVCLPAPVNLSTGSVMVILFFVFLVIYLVGGVLFLRIARGAQGAEMIPNREFWLDFPLLVKEGVYFVCSGCKTDTTYQQI
ncbi:uncharacterized protein LOC135477470 [Liolophura sinensis]|uniref:uncharacterized protein LOC135477470 n=1 Tax=Liolophura sinensis TaxID=3198878 RepID=UPI00315827BD